MKRALAAAVALLFLATTGCAATSKGLSRNAGRIATGAALAAAAVAVNAAANAPPTTPTSDEAQEAGRRDRARRAVQAEIDADEKLRRLEEQGDDAPPSYPSL